MASMKILISLFIVSVLVSEITGATVFRQTRAVAENTTSQKTKNDCEHTTPCGWAVYERFTRNVEYFMKNKCECPDAKKCLKTDDDISVTAYVYRCKATDNPEKENES